jgi:peptidoglycan hydrolase CwlO-like protein
VAAVGERGAVGRQPHYLITKPPIHMSNSPATKLKSPDTKIQYKYSQLKFSVAELKRELTKAQKKIAKLETALRTANERVKIVEAERYLAVRPRLMAMNTLAPPSK